MAYIAPDSKVRILHNIPLDPDYVNTKDFASAGNQTTFFQNLTKYNLANVNYQRTNKNSIRVEIRTELLYDCNYMMFQNTAFGNKWFYAFITKVDYINNITSEITYEIDVLQSWQFDYTLNMCLVEREHSDRDNIGYNITTEPIDVGEYVFNSYESSTLTHTLGVIVAIVDVDGATVDGHWHDGVYSGATLYAFNGTNPSAIDNLLSQYIQSPESVVGVYMCPIGIIPTASSSGTIIPDRAIASQYSIQDTAVQVGDQLDGYIPKNNKMYTYPYNFFHVDNANGDSLSLRYEFFDNLRPELIVEGCFTQPVEVVARPHNYKNVSGNDVGGYATLNTEALTISNFPMCSWNMDSWRAWVAQSAIPALTKAGVSTIVGGGVAGGVAVGNVLLENYQASIKADMCKGNFRNGGANTARHKNDFFYGRCSVTYDKARIIDNFFTKFGYACNRVKQPYTHSRPSFNYVKTVGCTINGSIPCDDEKLICSIYDRGVTIWHEGVTVGNYDANNAPV